MLPQHSRWKVAQVIDLPYPFFETSVTLTVSRDWPIWRWFFKPKVTLTFEEQVCRGVLDRRRRQVSGDFFDLGPFALQVLPADDVHPGWWIRCLVDRHDDDVGFMTTGTWTADEDGP